VAVLDTYINDDALLERLFAAAPFTRGTGEGGAPVREREGRQRERRIEECCGMGKGCVAVRKKNRTNRSLSTNQWHWWVILPNSRKLGFGGVPLEVLHKNHGVGGLLHIFYGADPRWSC
jgi:hypothetical protein